MDTSKEYIKMCEKAKEIQKNYKPNQGDIFWHPAISKITMWNGDWKEDIAIWKDKGGIWLPRQDQLQTMIQPNDKSARLLLKEFSIWSDQQPHTIINAFTSMEQLWLTFVMKEKYNKVWNGKEWRNNETK